MDTSFETWIIRALETSTSNDVEAFLEDAGFAVEIDPFVYETMPPKTRVTLSKDGINTSAYGFTVKEALITAYKEALMLENLPDRR